MAFYRSGSGGGKKVVENTFAYTTAYADQTITISGLSSIDSVIVYYPSSASVQCSAIVLNGTVYKDGYSANPTDDTIVNISGNQFTFKWQSATSFNYIAYGN